MTPRTQSYMLLLFGGLLLRLCFTDELLRYVRPAMRGWIIAASIVLILLAVWSLFIKSDEPTIDEHGHHGASKSAWLILGPVLAILVIAPPALGSYSASRLPATVAKPADVGFPPLPEGNPVAERMLDFAVRAVWDHGRTLAGHQVAVTGFVLRGADGGYLISRLVITCCAADARPVTVGVQTAAGVPPINSWVLVTGYYAGVSPTNAQLPVLQATQVRLVAEPANPYD